MRCETAATSVNQQPLLLAFLILISTSTLISARPVTRSVRPDRRRSVAKKRPTERCEMLGTRPRRIASSAISRWLQWLIGRYSPTASRKSSRSPRKSARGCMSQARPSAAHRRAAPAHTGRDAPVASARANTAPSSATRRVPARSRARQHSSAACNTMRARTANCCEVEWGSYQRLQRFALRRLNKHRIGGQQGHRNLPSQLPIRHATTPPIDSCFVARRKQPRSDYLRP